MIPSTVVAYDFKHEQVFNFKAVSEIFREVEGPRAWYQQNLLTDHNGFRATMRSYHEQQILSCSYRIEKYLSLLDTKLVNYGSFLLN